MREGTKKLFPTEYGKFVAAMIQTREENNLPMILRLDDIRDYTLKDLEDTFADFSRDTGLELTGMVTLNYNSGKLCLELKVDYPEIRTEKEIPLQ